MVDPIRTLLTENAKALGSVALIVIVGIVFYVIVKKGLTLLASYGVAAPLVRVLRIFLRWTLVIVVLLLVLQDLGVLQNVWSALLTVTAMVAMGFFAVWSILSNVLSTVLILIYKPFRIGDTIDVPSDNLAGTVEDLNLMFTTLKTEDDQLIQIPNNLFFQKPIRRKLGKGEISLYEQFSKRPVAK